MGIYLNPGKQSYQMAVNSEIFVDKTEMIRYLNFVVNTQQRYVSVSRPRRFGKTMAADMICAYYDREADSRELFANLRLSVGEGTNQKNPWDRYLGKFDVVRIVMTDFVREETPVEDSLKRLVGRVLDELDERYPGVRFDASDFTFSFDKFYRKMKETEGIEVVKEFKVLPGYGKGFTALKVAYVFLTAYMLLLCATPLAAVIVLFQHFA